MGCEKSQEFLANADVQIAEQADARKRRLGAAEALAMARKARRVVCARGRSVVEFDMTSAPPDDATLLEHLLGRSGTLRAPALCIADTLIIGFSEKTYRELLGGSHIR